MTQPTSQKPTTSTLTRWRVLAGALLIQVLLGTVYGYSIFWIPLSSEVFPDVITEARAETMVAEGAATEEFRIATDEAEAEEFRARHRSYLQYAFSICILSFALVMILAGRLQDRVGPRIPALIGAGLMGGGFIAAGLMANPILFYLAHAAFAGAAALALLSLAHEWIRSQGLEDSSFGRSVPLAIVTTVVVASLVLAGEYVGRVGEWDRIFLLWGTIGFLAGAGIGFAYICPIAALVKWFPRHKGLVSGLAVAGFGFGAYFFKGDPYIVSTGWFVLPIPGAQGFAGEHGIRALFLVHGLVCLIGIGIGAWLLKNPPETPATTTATTTFPAESTWQRTLRHPAFLLLWLMFFSGAMAGLMVIGIVQPFVVEQLSRAGLGVVEAAAAGTAAVGYLAIFNALGRIFWGVVSDKIGRTPVFIILFTTQAAVLLVLGTLSTPLMLGVAAALVGFNFGGNFAVFPSATSDFFGTKNLGANYGWLFTSYGIAGVAGIAAGNAARIQTGSYQAAFTIAALLCLVSVAFSIVLHRMKQ